MYLVQKMLNKLFSEDYTFFLDPKDLKEVTNHLKKNTYSIYKPYPDSEKNIIFINEEPDIILLEIKTNSPLRHQDILGTLYSLRIDDSLFGDIIITNNHYYFYTFRYMQTFFEMELTKIKNTNVELIEQDINLLKDYHLDYEEITLITSSLRCDLVLSKLAQTNRDNIKEMIKDKKIYLNYELLKDNSKLLHENDVFSIRKIGKFKFNSISNQTKKGNLVIKILKYKPN